MNKPKSYLSLLFSRKAVLGKLLLLYFFLAVFSVIGVYFIYKQNTQITHKTEKIIDYRQLISNYALKLDSKIHQISALGYKYLDNPSQILKDKIKKTWEADVKPDLDTLKSLIIKFEDEDSQKRISQLRKDIIPLRETWDLFLKSNNIRNLAKLHEEVDLLTNRIQRELLVISSIQENAIKNGLEDIEDYSKSAFQSLVVHVGLVLLLGFVFSFFIIRQFYRGNTKIDKALGRMIEGNTIPSSVKSKVAENRALAQSVNMLNESFKRLQTLAQDVGEGKFDTEIRVFDDKGMLGNALSRMRESLQQIAISNQERNWVNEGFAKFSDILRTYSNDSTLFYDKVISNLVEYLQATQGGIFALNSTDYEETVMELKAAFAYKRKKFLDKTFKISEGLIGQAWRERDILDITDIPPEYSEVASGLGQAKPRHIIVIPLLFNEEIYGVIELSSFNIFKDYQISFIQRLGESIATTITRLNSDLKTKKLLRESQEMAERMKAQEEEMTQSMEELVVTQEKMEQTNKQLEVQFRALENNFIMMDLDTKGYIRKVNHLMCQISGYTQVELLGQHFSLFLSKKVNQEQVQKDWEKVLSGDYIKGDFIRSKKNNKDYWLHEIIYPVFDNQRSIIKISSIAYDITTEKAQEKKIREQLEELQMSKRDVVNRIREVEGKAKKKMLRMQMEYQDQLREKDRIIEELKS